MIGQLAEITDPLSIIASTECITCPSTDALLEEVYTTAKDQNLNTDSNILESAAQSFQEALILFEMVEEELPLMACVH